MSEAAQRVDSESKRDCSGQHPEQNADAVHRAEADRAPQYERARAPGDHRVDDPHRDEQSHGVPMRAMLRSAALSSS